MQIAEAELSRGEGHTGEIWGDFQAALLDDLNTPAAVSTLSEPLRTMNELLVVRKKKPVRLTMSAVLPSLRPGSNFTKS